MALFSTLVDDFSDGTLGAAWTPNTYGGVTETGGRARIPCPVGDYAGLQSDLAYNINDDSLFAELVTLPASGGGGVVAVTFQIIQATAGTSLSFEIDLNAGTLRCSSNVAYWDAGATVLTFNHSVHRWFRFRADGSNVYWDTSADGISWTNRRTAAKPAWVTSTANAQSADFFCNRSGGTTDYAEWDNVNVAPVSGTDWENSFSDPEGITDSVTVGIGHGLSFSDSEGLTDSLDIIQGFANNPSDPVGLTDNIAFVQTEISDFEDSVGLTDGLFLTLGTPVDNSDPVGITDGVVFVEGHGLDLSDPVGISDSLSLTTIKGPPGPVSAGPENSLVLGPATLYIAPYGALEPENGDVADAPDLGVWTDLGGLFGGVELTVDQEWEEIRPKQVGYTVTRRLKRRKLSIKTQLAEPTLANLAFALNDTPSVTAGTGWQSYTPADQHEGTELDYMALNIDGWAPGFNAITYRHKRRRLIVRKVLSVDNVAFAYKKDGQSVFTVTWSCHYVDGSTPPFRVIDEA
jgi:hypothetical protein